MREILYKKRESVKKRRKVISISESSDKKDYWTSVRKHFIYFVKREETIGTDLQPPEIHIVKCFNSKTREEKFLFRVKGAFYIAEGSQEGQNIFRVDFRHTLNINIKWKRKMFSPKKSEKPLT